MGGFFNWICRTAVWLLKITIAMILFGFGGTLLLIGFIPGLWGCWIVTGIAWIIMGLLINHWWLHLGLIDGTKKIGHRANQGLRSIPDHMANFNEENILKGIKQRFRKIAEANGIEFDSFYQKVLEVNNYSKFRIKNLQICKQKILSPLQEISVLNNQINMEFNNQTFDQSKTILIANQLTDSITGYLLHNWLSKQLSNDQVISQEIDRLLNQCPISQLSQAFCRNENAQLIIRNSFLEKSDYTVILNDRIVYNNQTRPLPSAPNPLATNDMENIKITKDIEINVDEDSDFKTQIDPSNPKKDSGSLNESMI